MPRRHAAAVGEGFALRGKTSSQNYAMIAFTTLPVHVGQPEVAALEPNVSRSWSMPRQCEDRGVEVVDVDGVLDDVVAEVVGLAVDDAGLDAAAGHPHGEAAAVVVAAVVVAGQRALAVDRPAELAAPDDQRVVEQAALLQVVDRARRRAGRRPCTGRGSAWAGCRAGPSRGA